MKKHTFQLVFLRYHALKTIATNSQNVSPIVNNFLSQYHICLVENPVGKTTKTYLLRNIYQKLFYPVVHFSNSYVGEQIICCFIEGLFLMLCQRGLCFELYFREGVYITVLSAAHPHSSVTVGATLV